MKKVISLVWEQMRIIVYVLIGLALMLGFFQLLSKLPESPQRFVAPKAKSASPAKFGDYKLLDWRTLRLFDLDKNEAPEQLKAYEGKGVQVPGFIVPLEDAANLVSEFLLVPSPQACIHVPPPPPNQMIYVKMKEPLQFDWAYRAFWVMGKLSLKTVESPYGSVSFEMSGDTVRPYDPKDAFQ